MHELVSLDSARHVLGLDHEARLLDAEARRIVLGRGRRSRREWFSGMR